MSFKKASAPVTAWTADRGRDIERLGKRLNSSNSIRSPRRQPRTLRVAGDILADLERLIVHLEQRGTAETRTHPVQAGDLFKAAKYLSLALPPGSPIYKPIIHMMGKRGGHFAPGAAPVPCESAVKLGPDQAKAMRAIAAKSGK